MAKKRIQKCWNCGKIFAESYQLLLHYDFHKGEPVIRAMACGNCAQDADIRSGVCNACGYVFASGWRVINGEAVTK